LHSTVRETGKGGTIELITGNGATKEEVINIGLNRNLTDGVVVLFPIIHETFLHKVIIILDSLHSSTCYDIPYFKIISKEDGVGIN
jgi:hypothetical protein